MLIIPCPLCSSERTHPYFEDDRRRYQQCSECELVFVEPAFLPSHAREKQEYDLHENHFDDEGYRRFLQRAAQPVIDSAIPPSCGLDFGSGPSPVLADMLIKHGFEMSVYDPIYAQNTANLEKKYHFITCTEAIEHFHKPAREIAMLYQMLLNNGLLVIMTKRVENREKFSNWHYKNDQTHVSFFSDQTFHYIGKQYGFSVTLYSKDVVLLKKHP